jgi:hypothetical protein
VNYADLVEVFSRSPILVKLFNASIRAGGRKQKPYDDSLASVVQNLRQNWRSETELSRKAVFLLDSLRKFQLGWTSHKAPQEP